MTSCEISGNTAADYNGDGAAYSKGGGFYISGGTVTMTSCEISGNKANNPGPYYGGNGGGLYIAGSTVTMTSCEISGNTAVSFILYIILVHYIYLS